jgi:integrase
VKNSKFFSTTGNSPSSGFSKPKKGLDKLAQLRHYTLHDLRRSFDTGCARIGIRHQVIEKCLNHSLGVYNRHDYTFEMRDAWTKWGHHISRLIRRRQSQKPPKPYSAALDPRLTACTQLAINHRYLLKTSKSNHLAFRFRRS